MVRHEEEPQSCEVITKAPSFGHDTDVLLYLNTSYYRCFLLVSSANGLLFGLIVILDGLLTYITLVLSSKRTWRGWWRRPWRRRTATERYSTVKERKLAQCLLVTVGVHVPLVKSLRLPPILPCTIRRLYRCDAYPW